MIKWFKTLLKQYNSDFWRQRSKWNDYTIGICYTKLDGYTDRPGMWWKKVLELYNTNDWQTPELQTRSWDYIEVIGKDVDLKKILECDLKFVSEIKFLHVPDIDFITWVQLHYPKLEITIL